MRQIMDARLDPESWPIPARNREETADARAYLTTPSKDLETVCSLAGVDMEVLVGRMQKRIADIPAVQADPARAKRQATRLPKGQTITHDGKSLTVMQWAKATGIPPATLYSRIKTNWPVADMLTVPASEAGAFVTQKRAKRIEHNGEALTVAEWSARLGVYPSTIRARISKGLPLEEVLRAA